MTILDTYIETGTDSPPPSRVCLSADDRSRLFALRETGSVVEGLSRDPAYWRGRHGAVVERAELEDIIVGSSLEARK
jgi:hypothetical protein